MSIRDISAVVDSRKAGDEVTLTVRRKGETATREVKLRFAATGG
jgi:PDZ domain-containing secreted protein